MKFVDDDDDDDDDDGRKVVPVSECQKCHSKRHVRPNSSIIEHWLVEMVGASH